LKWESHSEQRIGTRRGIAIEFREDSDDGSDSIRIHSEWVSNEISENKTIWKMKSMTTREIEWDREFCHPGRKSSLFELFSILIQIASKSNNRPDQRAFAASECDQSVPVTNASDTPFNEMRPSEALSIVNSLIAGNTSIPTR
jgi:hypothetical protein